MVKRSAGLALVCILAVGATAVGTRIASPPSPPASPEGAALTQPETTLAALPLHFIENRGQMPGDIGYYAHGAGASLAFSQDGLGLSLADRWGTSQRWNLRLEFVDARTADPVGKGVTPAVVSYFRGPPSEWVTGLPTYSRMTYRDLWPGIDLVYSGSGGRLKYSLVVAPGADPSDIRLAWHGATGLTVNAEGQVQVATPAGRLVEDAPSSYQVVAGRRAEVPSAFALRGGEGYGFELGGYDPSRTLVIDPTLVYAGFVGGDLDDRAFGVAVDSTGAAYIAGYTESLEATFPDTVGPDVTFQGGTSDAFVAKVNPSGTGLVYAGYMGGTDDEQAGGIAVDGSGRAYVAGRTDSTQAEGFPVSGGPDLLHNGGFDAFVARVNASGTGLEYAGYIGGSGFDEAAAVAAGGDGGAFVTGFTDSSEATFPDTVGPDTSYNMGGDAFVAKVQPSGASLAYAGYIGGAGSDGGDGIAVGPGGAAYVTGNTASDQGTFPEKVGPDLVFNGGTDAFVAQVTVSGNDLVYAGYIGGDMNDFGRGIAVDGAGAAFVTGDTGSDEATFPEKAGPDLTFNGDVDAFVAKVQPSGGALDFAGYLGGTNGDIAYEVGLDSTGNVYLAGQTNSPEATFPETVGPDLTHNGGFDAFVAKLAPSATAILYAGYLGGSGSDFAYGLAVNAVGNAFVVGKTDSTETTFPVLGGPDLTQNSGEDAFVAKVVEPAPPGATCKKKAATLVGTGGKDTLTGTPGRDVVAALGGKDKIRTLGGNDLVCAGGGNDTANGGSGKDKLFGEGGKDKLKGLGGNDRLKGGPQRDTCSGGAGRDKASQCEKEKGIP
jgi:Ca2+-binding RTX toxin-like protein